MSEDKSDKGKFIIGAPPKVGKEVTKQNNHRSTNKKFHFYHYYGAFGHTHLNWYKWLAA